MKLAQKLTYKLSKQVAMLALAGASLFTSCNKDDGLEQHDTVYYFDPGDVSEIENYKQIGASADSVEVRHIIFKVRYQKRKDWSGADMDDFYTNCLRYAFTAADGKGIGSPDVPFKGILDIPVNRDIEPTYRKLGFGPFQYYSLEEQNQR